MHFLLFAKVQKVIMAARLDMTLKELRIEKELTQAQAAALTRISLRSYKDYENDASKANTVKYQYLLDELEKVGFIDEDHGLLKIDQIKKTVGVIFLGRDVKYCYLFGSYAKGTANEKSDVDLLVATSITGMAFYGLAEQLRQSLGKRVDLLNTDQLTNNPHLIDEILKDGIKIYG